MGRWRAAEGEGPPIDRLGPYRFVRPLGRGGMAEVFEGFDTRLERPVALKRVHPARTDERTIERLRREAKAVARLSHPAIVQVHDWVDDASGHWMVMELIRGESLREHMGGGALPLSVAVRLAHDVASGLRVAHQAGIVHRDLKADNVMVTDAGRAKILDFGLAKQVLLDQQQTSLTLDGKILGTVTAMSPEQALGQPVDPRSDLFSFGTLLYRMSTGVAPFRAKSPMETLTRICTWPHAPIDEVDPDLPEDLARMVDQLLQKEPVRRLQSTDEALRVLEAVAARLTGESTWTATRLAPPKEDGDALPSASEATRGASPLPSEDTTATLPGTPAPGDGRKGASEGTTPPALWPWAAPWPWVLILAAGVLAVAFWAGFGDRVSAPAGTDSEPKGQTADPGAMDDYQLYRHGMGLLERYDREGNLDKAIEAFQRLLTRDPDSAPGFAGLAQAYWQKHKNASKDPQWLEQARAAADRAVDLDPFLVSGRISLGRVLLESGDPAAADEQFRRVLQLEPEHVGALEGLAERELAEGRLADAETLYRRALTSAPERWSTMARLGSLLYRTGRLDEAAEAFEGCIDVTADNFVCHRNLAGVHYAQGRYREASQGFQRALEIRPTATLYGNLGVLLFYQGLYPQAVEAFEKALDASGANDHRMWANLADAYRWTPGFEAQAGESYRRAIQLVESKLDATPGDVDLGSRRSLYLAKAGDCGSALAAAETLPSPEATDSAVFFRLATAFEVCGLRDRALLRLADALQGGYSLEDLRRDPELLGLRGDPRYHQLVAGYEDR
ncbi:MAG: protein kinase [Acidobacteriota bacterium]